MAKKFTTVHDSSSSELEDDNYLSTASARLPSSSSSMTLPAPTTPLLDDAESQTPLKVKKEATPLPKLQLFILLFVRLAEPIAFTQIFPYINQLVEELNIAKTPAEVGFYSGLVDSLFAFAQLFSVYQWGRLSDRIGRRPVIFTGLTGVAIATMFFGLSNSFWGILAARFLAGCLSGNVAVVNSVLGEITDETNQARAFPLTGVTWNVGCVIGPLIGGLLSHPAERYPNVFGNIQLLKDRPYFLPCFISSCLTACSIVFGYYFLDETLPRAVKAKKAKEAAAKRLGNTSSSSSSTLRSYGTITTTSNRNSSATNDAIMKTIALEEEVEPRSCVPNSLPAPTTAPTTELGILDLIKIPKVRAILISGTLLAWLAVAWEVVFVLFAYTPVKYGGLSKGTAEIGYALSGIGFFGILAALVIFPWLNGIFGTLSLYGALISMWPLCFAILPALNWVAKWSHAGTPGGSDVPVWIGIAIALTSSRVACMAFGANMILVKASAPSQETLGAVFGLAQSVGSLSRATSPAIVSSLFALSVNKNILGGNMVWIVMCGLSFLGIFTLKGLRQAYQSSNQL